METLLEHYIGHGVLGMTVALFVVLYLRSQASRDKLQEQFQKYVEVSAAEKTKLHEGCKKELVDMANVRASDTERQAARITEVAVAQKELLAKNTDALSEFTEEMVELSHRVGITYGGEKK